MGIWWEYGNRTGFARGGTGAVGSEAAARRVRRLLPRARSLTQGGAEQPMLSPRSHPDHLSDPLALDRAIPHGHDGPSREVRQTESNTGKDLCPIRQPEMFSITSDDLPADHPGFHDGSLPRQGAVYEARDRSGPLALFVRLRTASKLTEDPGPIVVERQGHRHHDGKRRITWR